MEGIEQETEEKIAGLTIIRIRFISGNRERERERRVRSCLRERDSKFS